MAGTLSSLQPKRLWEIFEEVCKYPRPSKKEEKIVEYILGFANKHGLIVRKDKVGNILISKPATKGYEKLKSVVLQSHLDMVCEKNSGVTHNFEKDPIIPYIDGNWVKAKDTTLGADDGIGIAAQLAILESDSIPHGPIECLFTVDEESGMTGAFGLEKGFLESNILLNLDSEDEGELFIGCAGGKDTLAYFDVKYNKPNAGKAYTISVDGLRGGHSGDDISKEYGNAVKLITRILYYALQQFNLQLANIDAGNLRNAIPREAKATIVIPNQQEAAFIELVNHIIPQLKEELAYTEPKLAIGIESAEMPNQIINEETVINLINAMFVCPNGPIHMTPDIPGLVETSTNLASVKIEGKKIVVTTSQRSSVATRRDYLADYVARIFVNAGATIEHSDGYPGWKPNLNSPILEVTKQSYITLFKQEPKVLAIHAGLECGLIGEKFPGMDMISFGPTIKGAHSPDERIDIPTTQKFWDLLLHILKHIPKK